MRKKLFLALLLVAAVALSGCSLVVKDQEVDARRVIVDVNGETVDKETVIYNINSQLYYMAQLYSQLGMSYDVTSDANVRAAAETVINGLVDNQVTEQKAKELKLDVFTQEENAEIEQNAAEAFETEKQGVITNFFADSELDEAALSEQAIAYMQERGVTMDTYIAIAQTQMAVEKLRAETVKDVAVTQEEIQAELDTRVETARTSYETNLSSFGTAVNAGTTVYYAPAGYRYVKQVLVQLNEEDSAVIDELNTQLTAANATLTSQMTALSDNAEQLSAEDITDEEKAALESSKLVLEQGVADAQKAVDDLNAQLATAQDAAYVAIKAEADEVYAKAAAGESFAELMAAHNDDPGMTVEPGLTNGYAVCEGYSQFESSFVDAAMALKNVGDVSEPIRGSYGYYIIRYESDVAEGPIATDAVKDAISATLLTTKQNETYDAAVEQWKKEANVRTYIDRVFD